MKLFRSKNGIFYVYAESTKRAVELSGVPADELVKINDEMVVRARAERPMTRAEQNLPKPNAGALSTEQ